MSTMGQRQQRRCGSRAAPHAFLAIFLAVTLFAAGCEKRGPVDSPATPASPLTQPALTVAAPAITQASWAPNALEELLAPIALYPDQLLTQILAASINSQEVLDGGNWLLQNQSLQGEALDTAARQAGFGAPLRALLQFPTVIDMLCQQIDWTRQLGAAFTSDQRGVLDAVQRLRAQAASVGNLQSTPQQTVETRTENDKVIVEVKPANPEVVYVPQYDAQAVYTTPPPAPAAAPSTTVVQDEGTVSTETAVLGGLLAFGAGVLVGNAFDDDDDDCCYPNWGSSTVIVGARPFYPAAYTYRPAYSGNFRPAYRYAPPAGYRNSYNATINVNNNYYNRFSNNQNLRTASVQSPLRTAQPQATREARAQTGSRSESWKGQSTYQGAPSAATSERLSQAAGTRPDPSRRQDVTRAPERAGTGEVPARSQPQAQQEIDRRANRDVDRGYEASDAQQRAAGQDQTRATAQTRQPRDDAFSGSRANDSGSFDRAASARGRASAGGMQSRQAHAGGGGRRRG